MGLHNKFIKVKIFYRHEGFGTPHADTSNTEIILFAPGSMVVNMYPPSAPVTVVVTGEAENPLYFRMSFNVASPLLFMANAGRAQHADYDIPGVVKIICARGQRDNPVAFGVSRHAFKCRVAGGV